jgi:hypothetical protein
LSKAVEPCWGAGCYAGLRDCAYFTGAPLRHWLARGVTQPPRTRFADLPTCFKPMTCCDAISPGVRKRAPYPTGIWRAKSSSSPEHQRKRSQNSRVSLRRRGSALKRASVVPHDELSSLLTSNDRRAQTSLAPGPRRTSGLPAATAPPKSPGFSQGASPRGATPAFPDQRSCGRQVETSEASSRMRLTSTANVAAQDNRHTPRHSRAARTLPLLFPC